MEISRRKLLLYLSQFLSLSSISTTVHANKDNKTSYAASQYNIRKKKFTVVTVDAFGHILNQLTLPDRGHGCSIRPGQKEAVIIGRRPGKFAVAFGLDNPNISKLFAPPSNRQFQGHAIFSKDGNYLFVTENNLVSQIGVIGVYDVNNSYVRVGEFSSYGIGPHEISLIPKTNIIVVANGGIITHPDLPEIKLNTDTMEPSLAYIDYKNGKLIDQYTPQVSRYKKLSIRHLIIPSSKDVIYACQDQTPYQGKVPLVSMYSKGTKKLKHFRLPEKIHTAIGGYCGSITADISGMIVAVSAPRGNYILFWKISSQEFLGYLTIADGCGISSGIRPGEFAVTNSGGYFSTYNAIEKASLNRKTQPEVKWDNHLTAVH